MTDLWRELCDPDYLRGVVYRHDAQIREHRAEILERLNEIRNELIDEIREVRREVETRNDWRETTDVRTQRRIELDSLRARAGDAEGAELELQRERTRHRRIVTFLSPAIGAVLYALAELVKSLIHH